LLAHPASPSPTPHARPRRPVLRMYRNRLGCTPAVPGASKPTPYAPEVVQPSRLHPGESPTLPSGTVRDASALPSGRPRPGGRHRGGLTSPGARHQISVPRRVSAPCERFRTRVPTRRFRPAGSDPPPPCLPPPGEGAGHPNYRSREGGRPQAWLDAYGRDASASERHAPRSLRPRRPRQSPTRAV